MPSRRDGSELRANQAQMKPLSITIVSDVVCPWCLIGEKRLELALEQRPEVEAEITFLPFLLDPTTPIGGKDLRENLRRKYGVDPESMFGRVEQAARESGIPLDFRKVLRSPNTLAAHVLIDAAEARGTQRELAKSFFHAYFLEGRDVGDPDVVANIASDHGFDREEAYALATDEQAKERIRAFAAEQSRAGVTGVPFFVFDDRYAVSGAQSVETFVRTIDAVLAKRVEAH